MLWRNTPTTDKGTRLWRITLSVKKLSTAIYYTSSPRGKSPTTTPNQIQHLHNLCISAGTLHSPAIPSIYVGHFSFHRTTSIISRLCRTIHVNIYPYEIFMWAARIALQRYTHLVVLYYIFYILVAFAPYRFLSSYCQPLQPNQA